MEVEHSSCANFNDIRIVHASFDIDVDVEKHAIEAYVVYNLEAARSTDKVVLDSSKLEILGISGQDGPEAGPALDFTIEDAPLGSRLTIRLPKPVQPQAAVNIGIHFKVSEASSAVQFLGPEQTAAKQHPFMFTQCQAIHARALVPCQDTPNVKMAYRARVTVGEPLVALMSARSIDAQSEASEATRERFPRPPGAVRSVHFFDQPVPIPSYLLALAVGQLESEEIGPVTRVWAEPPTLKAAAAEFQDTNKFLEAGVAIAGPYRWQQYDVLVLPPSFPYGGMENPCLTFVTPTLLTGDRSATNVIAHEISHSWSGNLVTNATWEHFWLNEGWTVLLERKILGRVFGSAMEQFHACMGLKALEATVQQLGAEHQYTALVPDLQGGADPDDAFSKIPYEKGFYFLYHLQTLVGGPETWEPFMRAYFDAFALKTCSSGQFKQFVLDYFPGNEALRALDWDTWFYKPGMPPRVNQYDTSLVDAAHSLAERWRAESTAEQLQPAAASAADVQGWSPDQMVVFLTELSLLTRDRALSAAQTRALAVLYGLDSMKHPDVRCKWIELCMHAQDEAMVDDALLFAREQGRMKFVRPLYKALYNSPWREAAVKQFRELGSTYHPIAQKMLAADLHLV